MYGSCFDVVVSVCINNDFEDTLERFSFCCCCCYEIVFFSENNLVELFESIDLEAAHTMFPVSEDFWHASADYPPNARSQRTWRSPFIFLLSVRT